MHNLILLATFLIGLTVGSFLNCLIHRLSKGEGFLLGRSRCPHCQHILTWQDLIPVLSFIILKGKCRYCQKLISWQYPLVELATGILFVLIFWILDFGFDLTFGIWILDLLCYLLIASFLIIIFVYDLKHYIIPDKVIFPAIGIAFFYNILNSYFIIHNSSLVINSLLSAFLASVFFLTIVLISRGKWMGVGDVKLAFLMGLFLGFPNILVALFLAFFIGGIIGIGLIAIGKKTLKSEIPFGPFLVTGTFFALFWGEKLIDLYFSLLFK